MRDRGRCRRGRADLRRPAARGRAPGRRASPATCRWRRRRRWRPRSGTPTARFRGQGHGLGARRRTPSSTRSPTPTRSRACGWSTAPRCSPSRQPDPWWRRRRPVAGPADARCRPGTSTAGRSRRPSSRCRSTCRGWPAGSATLGGTITRMNLRRCPTGADLVVNCSGLGARLLGGGPVGGAGARPGGVRRAGRARPLVARPRGPDVRRPAQQATSSSAAPTTRGSGAARPTRTMAREILARARDWCRSSAAPGCCGTRWAAAGAPRRPPRAGRRRHPLLRPRRRGRHPELGRGRRGGLAAPKWSAEASACGRVARSTGRPERTARVATSRRLLRRAGGSGRRGRAARRSRRPRRRCRGRWRAPGPGA